MTTPLVSVCLPNLNTRPFLEERMETLLAQTFTDFEIVISDNFSDDGSWEFFQKFKSDPRVQLAQAPRRGMYANWNECARRSRGQYLYMATSDDTASPALLERLTGLLERFPQARIAACNLQAIDEQSRPIVWAERFPSREFYGDWFNIPSIRSGLTEFLMHICFGTVWVSMTTVLFHRSVYEQAGPFPTNLGSQGDEEWSQRAALTGDVVYWPERLATWRVHGRQATARVVTPGMARGLVESAMKVIHDPKAGIPEAWKKIEGWDRLLLTAKQADYFASYRLWRRAAAEAPGRTWQGAWRALKMDPGLLLRQACRAFAWSDDFGVDRLQLASKMIETFGAAWPPTRFEAPAFVAGRVS